MQKRRKDKLLTAKEAAVYLSVSQNTLMRLQRRRLIKWEPTSEGRRYSEKILKEYLNTKGDG